jgi:uncharacterized protein YlaI
MSENAPKLVLLERACNVCEITKPVSEFHFKAQNLKKNGGYTYKCKDCDKAYKKKARKEGRLDKGLAKARTQKYMDSLKDDPEKMARWQAAETKKRKKYNLSDKYLVKTYGITLRDVKAAYENQHGLCANRGCGLDIYLDVPLGNNRAVIDHCHQTGKFRALLCMQCNTSLGQIEKSKNKFLGLMEYEEKHNNLNGV